ncbi:DUF1254 domain-containing protein [Nocardia stercoris]|nr:DUF1254 domain-containing protein [Nocardia stercoris]
MSRRGLFGVGLAVTAGTVLAACGSGDSERGDDGGEPADSMAMSTDPVAVATDAYIFGYPLVLIDATRGTDLPVDTFMHAAALPTPADRVAARTDLDTLRSQAWLDLSAEPLVLQIPATDGNRYWLMQLIDAWSNTAHNPSSVRPQVVSGTEPPFTYLVTGPGWTGTVPAGMTRLAMNTNRVWVVGRIQLDGPDDIDAVRAIQQRIKLAPLHAYLADPGISTPGVMFDATAPGESARDTVAGMTPAAYFTKLCELMATDPPAAADAPAMQRFASLGIAPGGTLTAEPGGLSAGVQAAKSAIAGYADPAVQSPNGWTFSPGTGTYGTDYLLRAHVARTGLGANLPEDVIHPTFAGVADYRGTPQRFRIRFDAGQLPPAGVFWSITAYDADGFLMGNPAGIYAVGHRIPVTAGPDGSVDVAVQHADPGSDVPEGNWLPIAAFGRFTLTMRLYAPTPEAVQGRWQPPLLETVG